VLIGMLARRHGGHVSRRQLLAIGLGPGAIDYRISIGRLIPVHHGVYAVGRLPTQIYDKAAGALLACGPDSALARASAASLWKMQDSWWRPFEVITPRKLRLTGIKTYRSATLTAEDVRIRHGLRVTSPAWTILAIAPGYTERRLRRLIANARLDRDVRLKLHELQAIIDRIPNDPGARHVLPFLADDRNPTRSSLEDDLQRFIDHFGLPQPLINYILAGYEVDAYFPNERVIIEADDYATHGDRHTFESDRVRDATILAELGIPTIRITCTRLTELADEEADRVKAILARRRKELAATRRAP
jgi:putative AbiEi antitoxin of type IV toxin-antitoxin system